MNKDAQGRRKVERSESNWKCGLVPFLASLFYPAFGVSEWIGRSVSVAFFAVSVPCLFGIVKKLTNRTAASFAALTYTLAPLSIFASRSLMSDMPTLSLSIVGIYYFMKWLDDETSKSFVLMSLFTSLSILVKLPSAIIGLPLAYMAWQKYAASFLKSKDLWIFAAISLIPSVCWYTHAHFVTTAELVMGSGHTHVFGGDAFGIVSVGAYWRILERTLTSGLTPLVAAGMFAGLFLWPSSRFGRTFHWWLFAIVLFVIFAGEGNSHPWYQLPIVPVAAAFSGLAFERLLARISSVKMGFALARTVAIALIAALSYSAYVFVKPLYKPWARSYMKAGMAADLITPEGALVVVAGEGVPTAIYYSKRKGWHFWNPADSEGAIKRLEDFREQGATHLVVSSLHFWWLTHYKQFQTYLDAKYQRVAESGDYVIFDLECSLP